MSEQVCLNVDFNQVLVNDDVIEILANNLKENLNRDVQKVSLKESLALVAKGTKLQCGPANDLLICIIRSLSIPKVEPSESDNEADSESNEESELEPEEDNKEIEDDESLSQMLKKARKRASEKQVRQGSKIPDSKKTKPDSKQTKPDSDKNKTTSQNKNKELCRFYARGQCTRKQECRFNHPSICKKFRKFGSISMDKNGCDGKCDALHPNACRNSVRDRTCSWQDCKFFHLKGTKRINRNTNGSPNNQQNPSQNQITQQNQNRKGTGASGGQQWTNNRSHDQNHNNNQNYCRSTNNNDNYNGPYQGGPNAGNKQVFQQDQPELASTLQEIMRRLAAIETRQTTTPPLHMTTQLSPAVPQPGTQTQGRWGSPNQWTQSQY